MDDTQSRWSCAKGIMPDGGQCKTTFTFDSPQDLTDVRVAPYVQGRRASWHPQGAT